MKGWRYLPPMAVMFAAVLWSFDGFLRQNLPLVPFASFSTLISFSFMIILLEHALGGMLFLPVLFRWRKRLENLGERAWISVGWVAVFGGILGTVSYTAALFHTHYIELSVVVLLQKFQPLFAIALAAVILKEPLSRRYLAAAGTAFVGGYLVTFGLKPMAEWTGPTLVAALLALLAAFSWGSSTVLGKHALRRLPFFALTGLRLWVTTGVAAVIFFATPDRPRILALTGHQWLLIVAIVFSTGTLALFIYYYGLKHVPATHATIYELFWPLSAVVIDWAFRGKMLEPAQMAGGILLVGASVYLSRTHMKKGP
ncbi:MAG: DMT family transporter [Fidelibacterota bacterium]